MIDPGKVVTKKSDPEKKENLTGGKIVQAMFFGFVFGFLLQKGGVAKYHLLVGQLLLQDFTVIKVMMSAILVGMVGVYLLNKNALVNLDIKPTKLGSNIVGGCIFGAGFALIGYCPGTGAAAVGEGYWDAFIGIAGLMFGSILFAEFSGKIQTSIDSWGNLGKLTLPELFKIRRGAVVMIMCVIIAGALFAIEHSWPR